ncbi:hypothetical protein EDD90_1480 [Streptomyces sp. Ag109_O5-1]|nr:hypothetical protein EDD90_1480 [Streptomyces sp. Ag109_O5-1]
MEKLVRRIATAAVSLALAGGALLTAGGFATAAALPVGAAVPARAGVSAETETAGWSQVRSDGHRSDVCRHHASSPDRHGISRHVYDRYDPWIIDQLVGFGYVS